MKVVLELDYEIPSLNKTLREHWTKRRRRNQDALKYVLSAIGLASLTPITAQADLRLLRTLWLKPVSSRATPPNLSISLLNRSKYRSVAVDILESK